MQRSNLKFIILCISCLVHNTVISISQNISPKQIALVQNKYLRDKFVDEHHIDHYVHIPASVKEAVIECVTAYPELKSFINLSMFTQDTQHIISQEQASTITQELIALLKESPLKTSNPIDTTLTTLEQYLRDIESGKLHVASDPLLENIPLSPSGTRASQHLYYTNTGLAIAGGGILHLWCFKYRNSRIGKYCHYFIKFNALSEWAINFNYFWSGRTYQQQYGRHIIKPNY